jgi:MFS family permease
MSKARAEGKTAGWRQLLRDRNVRWLYAGQIISQVGDGVSKVALLWFVYAMTDSALKMSLVGVLQTIPPLIFGPFAGVLLDRIEKRRAMMVIDIVRTGLLATIPILYAFDLLTLSWLYVLVFVTAMFSMAFGPALNATLPLIVKKEQLTGVNALMQSAMTIGCTSMPQDFSFRPSVRSRSVFRTFVRTGRATMCGRRPSTISRMGSALCS